jgi:hypothetical protein
VIEMAVKSPKMPENSLRGQKPYLKTIGRRQGLNTIFGTEINIKGLAIS